MNWINAVIVVAGILSNASASVLIKIAMRTHSTLSAGALWQLATNKILILGIFLYGCAFVLYAAALSRLPLNVAHPILTAGAIGAVACASAFLLGEAFRWNTIVGLLLVTLGVIFISVNTSH
ncbi:MAG: EamA family transporter [Pandoraea sp.]|nr:EamA family transporter [Pandoraea sp.]MDR3396778.1 EamA family transporter [Pandoraea sp.]